LEPHRATTSRALTLKPWERDSIIMHCAQRRKTSPRTDSIWIRYGAVTRTRRPRRVRGRSTAPGLPTGPRSWWAGNAQDLVSRPPIRLEMFTGVVGRSVRIRSVLARYEPVAISA
jgi:hypothetical protein